jgi:hypothetical protein
LPRVEFLFAPDCPNVPAARAQLRAAFAATGLEPGWSEVDVTAPDTPAELRVCVSPTIRVNGRDVAPATPAAGAVMAAAGDGKTCRLYPGSEVRGAPSVASSVAALRAIG